MAVERNIEVYATRLADPALGEQLPGLQPLRAAGKADSYGAWIETKTKHNIATELRDGIEMLCASATYPLFLSKLWPVFKKILKGDPVFQSASWEQVRD